MLKCYSSRVERERLELELNSNIFVLDMSACSWFFPNLIRALVRGGSEKRRAIQFKIRVSADDEASSLQYLAAFLHWRKTLGQCEDCVLFSVDETETNRTVEKIYGRISRFLVLFVEEYGFQNRMLFEKPPKYVQSHVEANRMAEGQLWPYEKGGYGREGLPLIPVDLEVYILCQKNFYEFIQEDVEEHREKSWRGIAEGLKQGDKSLKAVAMREICKRFYKQFKTIGESKRYKSSKYGNLLKLINGADVLTFLLFGAAFFGIYNPGRGSATISKRTYIMMNENNFLTLYERCCAYSLGLLQLMENTISYTSGGFLSIRAIKRKSTYLKGLLNESDANLDDFLSIAICDVANLTDKNKYMSLREKFFANLQQRSQETTVSVILDNQSKVEMNDLFFPKPNSVLTQYLCEPENTGFHYGLQIFASAVEGAGGDFCVVSGDEATCSSSKLSKETENEDIRKRYSDKSPLDVYYCGTEFYVLLPISGVVEIENKNEFPIPSELSYEALPNIEPCCFSLSCEKYFPQIKKMFQPDCPVSISRKKDLVNALAKEIREEGNKQRKGHDLCPLVIQLDGHLKNNAITNSFLEILAKAMFFLLSNPSFQYRNMALIGFESNMHMVAFIRYYAQFYNRFGFNESYAKSSQIMIAASGKGMTRYITLSGKYIGKPLYEYTIFSGGKHPYDAESAMLMLALNKISVRTRQGNAAFLSDGERLNNPHCFDDVKFNWNGERVERWLIDLKEAVMTDFSSAKSVGAKIKNCVTHIHVSGVHIDAFYQIDQIFTNAYWAAKLGEWVAHLLEPSAQPFPIILYGYGHLTEPLLVKAKNSLGHCQYMIYEEGYHYTAEKTTAPQLSFSCSRGDVKDILDGEATIAFIMPISTTLATFKRMGDLLFDEFKDIEKENLKFRFVAVFQLVAEDLASQEISQAYFENPDKSAVVAKEPLLGGKSKDRDCHCLVKLPARWQRPGDCTFCYPEEGTYERMLYTTDDTSLIPTMQLQVFDQSRSSTAGFVKPLDFFEKDDDGKYLYAPCLIYRHIERQNSHFAHYIQTNSLLNCILENGKFAQWAKETRTFLGIGLDWKINIIVAPSHISNQRFPIEINEAIFDGKAHIVSVNAQKIYRSNFEAEFSNYSLLLNTLLTRLMESKRALHDCVRFVYVDDNINTGSTYARIKSLIRNLFHVAATDNPNGHLDFDVIITMVDRHSPQSLQDYVDDPKRYISLFRINVPAVRTNGDSCTLCKRESADKTLEFYAALDTTAEMCAERRNAHSIMEISDAKKKIAEIIKEDGARYRILQQRHMRRFEVENALWNIVREIETEHYKQDDDGELSFLRKLYENIAENIFREINKLDSEEDKIEYLISFLKVLSRPFLSFRPFVATVAIAILRGICDNLLNNNFLTATKDSRISVMLQAPEISDRTFCMDVSFEPERKMQLINLLIVCLSGLSGLNSTYILDTEKIIKCVNFHNVLRCGNSIYDKLLQGKENISSGQWGRKSFADYVRFSVFQLVHHEKYGKVRREKFDQALIEVLSEPSQLREDAKLLLSLLYLENGTIEPEDTEMKEARQLLRDEIVTDEYREEELLTGEAQMLADSIAYIDEEELRHPGDQRYREGDEETGLVLTPITTRGYCDAYDVGFDVHFGGNAKKHKPIVRAINHTTNQLCGKVELTKTANRNLRMFGISIFDPKGFQMEDKYIFLKFSNDFGFFAPSIQMNNTVEMPQMPPLYLRVRGNWTEGPLCLLTSIRKIIIQRRNILQKLAVDLSTEDMHRLIAERRFNRALSITKASKHATEEAERLMHYDFECKELSKKLVGQVRRLLANRTISGLYQVESMMFEQENQEEETMSPRERLLTDSDEITGIDDFVLWAEDDPMDKYTQIWDLLKNSFRIYGCKEGNPSQNVSLQFVIDPSVKASTTSYTMRYKSFQEKKLTLDFLFLLANNAIRHLAEEYSKEEIVFTIGQQGEYLSVSSPMGKMKLDKAEIIRNARSLVIPPHVRKYFKDRGVKGAEEETDGITLWSLGRYFRRLEMHVEHELGVGNRTSSIVPITCENDNVEVGFDCFKIAFIKTDSGYNYMVKMKCIKEQ